MSENEIIKAISECTIYDRQGADMKLGVVNASKIYLAVAGLLARAPQGQVEEEPGGEVAYIPPMGEKLALPSSKLTKTYLGEIDSTPRQVFEFEDHDPVYEIDGRLESVAHVRVVDLSAEVTSIDSFGGSNVI